jgi:mRNA interferase MazF
MTMKTSEIWRVNFDPTVGAEIKKTRPAVIVSLDAIGVLPLRVIVPITDWKDAFARRGWMVRIEPGDLNGLRKISAADAFQVRSVAIERFQEQLGILAPSYMAQLRKALAGVFNLHITEEE